MSNIKANKEFMGSPFVLHFLFDAYIDNNITSTNNIALNNFLTSFQNLNVSRDHYQTNENFKQIFKNSVNIQKLLDKLHASLVNIINKSSADNITKKDIVTKEINNTVNKGLMEKIMDVINGES